MHNAIPEHSEASLATQNGKTNITATVATSHIMIILRFSYLL